MAPSASRSSSSRTSRLDHQQPLRCRDCENRAGPRDYTLLNRPEFTPLDCRAGLSAFAQATADHRSLGGGGQAPPSSLHFTIHTSSCRSMATSPWSGNPSAPPSDAPVTSRWRMRGRLGKWPASRISRSSPASRSRIHSGGSVGCKPRIAENSAEGLHALLSASAVWRARSFPLCQMTSGRTPRAAASAARRAACARPPGERGR